MASQEGTRDGRMIVQLVIDRGGNYTPVRFDMNELGAANQRAKYIGSEANLDVRFSQTMYGLCISFDGVQSDLNHYAPDICDLVISVQPLFGRWNMLYGRLPDGDFIRLGTMS